MKIAIDAKWFFKGPPSGRLVIRNLLKSMIEINEDHELLIFLDKRNRFDLFPYPNDKIRLVYVWGNNNLLSNVFIIPLVAFRYKIDVMIFQNFIPFCSNFRRIAFIHDLIFLSHPDFFTLKERIYLYPIRVLASFAHKICTVSNSEKQRISKYIPLKKNYIDVVYNGVDPSFKVRELYSDYAIMETRRKYNLPEKFILYVGRLNERKNIKNLLLAMTMIGDPQVQLVIAGSLTNKMFNIDNVTKDLKITEKVHLTGYVDDEDLQVLYSLATVFCFPSFEEGFGLPPLEAMASGVPVVVSNRSSLPEVCGDAAVYCDPDSPKSIADAINNLLNDPNYYTLKKEQGLSWAKEFNWNKSAKKLFESVANTIEN